MTRKFISFLLVILMSFSMAACGGSDNDSGEQISTPAPGTGGGGGNEVPTVFTEEMLIDKTIYFSDSDGYYFRIFADDGTIKLSSFLTEGTPVEVATGTWEILSNGKLQISFTSGSTFFVETYTLQGVNKASSYWDLFAEAWDGTANERAFYDQSTGLTQAIDHYLSFQSGNGGNGGDVGNEVPAALVFTLEMLAGKSATVVFDRGDSIFNFAPTGDVVTTGQVTGTYRVNQDGTLTLSFPNADAELTFTIKSHLGNDLTVTYFHATSPTEIEGPTTMKLL